MMSSPVLKYPPVSSYQVRGPWDAETVYEMNDQVTFSGATYTSLIDSNLNHQPDISPTAWQASFALPNNVAIKDTGNALGGIGGTPLNAGAVQTVTDALYPQLVNNLSDLPSKIIARTNLGLGSAATENTNAILQSTNNLSDVTSVTVARSNLGLGSAATQAFNVPDGVAKLGDDGTVGGPNGSPLASGGGGTVSPATVILDSALTAAITSAGASLQSYPERPFVLATDVIGVTSSNPAISTIAIQAADAAARSVGRQLFFPGGVYHLAPDLLNPLGFYVHGLSHGGPMRWQGEGKYLTTFIVTRSTLGPAFSSSDPTNFNDQLMVCDMQFEGDNTFTTHCFFMASTRHVRMHRVNYSGFLYESVYSYGQRTRLAVLNPGDSNIWDLDDVTANQSQYQAPGAFSASGGMQWDAISNVWSIVGWTGPFIPSAGNRVSGAGIASGTVVCGASGMPGNVTIYVSGAPITGQSTAPTLAAVTVSERFAVARFGGTFLPCGAKTTAPISATPNSPAGTDTVSIDHCENLINSSGSIFLDGEWMNFNGKSAATGAGNLQNVTRGVAGTSPQAHASGVGFSNTSNRAFSNGGSFKNCDWTSNVPATNLITLLLAPASGLTATASTSGGSLADGTYYGVLVSESSGGGDNAYTAEVSATVSGGGGSGKVTFNWNLQSGVALRLYIGTTPGGENLFISLAAGTTSYVLQNLGSLTAGSKNVVLSFTSIPTGYTGTQTVLINTELITGTVSGTTLINCTRAVSGTTQVTHPANVLINWCSGAGGPGLWLESGTVHHVYQGSANVTGGDGIRISGTSGAEIQKWTAETVGLSGAGYAVKWDGLLEGKYSRARIWNAGGVVSGSFSDPLQANHIETYGGSPQWKQISQASDLLPGSPYALAVGLPVWRDNQSNDRPMFGVRTFEFPTTSMAAGTVTRYRAINLTGVPFNVLATLDVWDAEAVNSVGGSGPNVTTIDVYNETVGATLTTPTGLAGVAATSGGSMADGSYYGYFTAVNQYGETVNSSQVGPLTITGGLGNGSINWSWTQVTSIGITGYRLYVGIGAGSENNYFAISGGTTTTFTQTLNPSSGVAAHAPSIDRSGNVWSYAASALSRGLPLKSVSGLGGQRLSIRIANLWNVTQVLTGHITASLRAA